MDAPSPVNMSRDLPSAPPSPPDPAELDDSAPAATEFDALATVEQEVEKLDGVGDALTSESVADFAAADLAVTERSESPAAKPRRIANRLRLVDDGEAAADADAPGDGDGNERLRGAALTIQRAMRAKRATELVGNKAFSFADISRAATKKEEKRKLAARIAESEVS